MAKSWEQHDRRIMRILNANTPKALGGGVVAHIGGGKGSDGQSFFFWSIKTKEWRATSTFYKRLSDSERGLERFLRRAGHTRQADRWVQVKAAGM
jgi:hypothetical protein